VPARTDSVWHPRRQAAFGRFLTHVDTRTGGGGQIVTTTATEPTTKVGIKPLEDRIVVQVLEAEQTTASGIVIPDTAKEKPQEGKVLAVGASGLCT
jgi:hypothetical protein